MSNLLINGQWVSGCGPSMTTHSPSDNELVWQGNAATAGQVGLAVDAARVAQQTWAATTRQDRQQIIEAFADQLTTAKAELAEIISRETGKPPREALAEVGAMINKVAISIEAQQQRAGYWQANGAELDHRPHGVMAVLGPYNFPGHLPNGHIVPALLAGNSVVFKPSESTPLTAEFTARLWLQAGLPDGVLNLVQGGRDTGEALAGADIDGLLFTGSSRAGIALHRALAGRPECILALEMGGNNPLVVADANDVEVAAWHIVNSAYISAGQRCTCARRLILVENDKTDQLVEQLVAAIDSLTVGHWRDDPEPFMGPVINAATANQLLEAQQNLVELGGKPLRLMSSQDSGECYLNAGLIDMTAAKDAPDEEWFGPLLQLYRVADFDSAVAAANNTRFGLAAGLISDDMKQQQQFKSQAKAGVLSINKPTAGASSKLPFGGVGASGNHRPSAFYAADYCAWPQAMTLGEATDQQSVPRT